MNTTTTGGAARRRAWRGPRPGWLGLLPVAGMLLATVAAGPADAGELSRPAAPAQQPGRHLAAASSHMTLAQAPAGLQAAVRSTLGQAGTAAPAGTAAISAAAQATLLPEDPAAAGLFGVAVAVSGDTALVSAPGNPDDTEAVYVFVQQPAGWVQQAKLTAADGTPSDTFGSAVALDGDTAVIGAQTQGGLFGSFGNGAAYVFVRSGTAWTQQAELTDPAGGSNESFGRSVGVSGNIALVGAPGARGSGAVFEYVRSGTTWSQQDTLTSSDGLLVATFGASLSLSGDTAVVGAPENSPGLPGAAYIFVSSGTQFSQQAKLTPAQSQNGDLFGASVALSGGTALVGAPGCCASTTQPGNSFRGAADVFVSRNGKWVNQAMLTARDGVGGDQFGSSVALSGGTAVVGAPTKNNGTGAAYEFLRNGGGWTQKSEFTAADGAPNDRLGFAVTIAPGTAIVGAPFHNGFRGQAYLFPL
jgi:FG-GAP repeat